MNIIKRLKLHRVATVFKYLAESWDNSAFVVKQCPQKNRLIVYFSLLYWYYFFGNDFNDYCTFRFWNKNRTQKKSYISFRRNDKLRFSLSSPRVYDLFLDKVKFNNRFSQYISREWVEVGDDDKTVGDFIKRHRTTIYKPRADFGGHGVVKISRNDEYKVLRGGVLEQRVENVDSLKRLAPGSLNTVRIVTFIDKHGQVHLLAAVLRMGNGTSFTDNYHDGGMACAIDIESGTLKGNAYGMRCVEYEKHPHSKIRFDGYKVEGFGQCLEMVMELAAVEPEARYVGWDFAITPSGIEVIEGNIPPGEDITQIAAGRGLWNEIKELI